jgi:glucose/arabinose dehydrogenase
MKHAGFKCTLPFQDDGMPCRKLPRSAQTVRVMLQLVCMLGMMLTGVTGCDQQSRIPTELRARLIADGFASPLELVSPPDDSGRLFVVDQVGLIWIISDGKRLDKPFLDIRDRLVQLLPFYDERGLLALAFDPHFTTNRQFYVYYSAPLRPGLSTEQWDHTTHISQFKVSAQDPNQADPASEHILLEIDKPGYNYEGGGLAFGPDGFLFIGVGDSVHDPSSQAGEFAQDTYSLLGKILRIDVSTSNTDVNSAGTIENYHIPPGNPFIHGGGRSEVFAYGFRNPYRISFDTGQTKSDTRLFVGDVGQAMMEELDLVQAGGNYGWPILEGTTCFNSKEWNRPLPHCDTAGLLSPLFEYSHAGKASAIVGGTIYKGKAVPGLFGDFVFGDWGRGPQSLFAAYPPADGIAQWSIQQIHIEIPGLEGGQLLGIGSDTDHELYILTKDPGIGPTGSTGRLYSIVAP